MGRTAILVDGGFYRYRSKELWGEHPADEAAEAMVSYCRRHLNEHGRSHDLYRIFYYDCPPIDKQMYHPLDGKTINLKASADSKWMNEFLRDLRTKRKVALRLGELDERKSVFTLKYDAVKKICAGSIDKDGLTRFDFETTLVQKGVDIKLGIDIASLSYKHQVDQIVLVAADRDFIPALKLARREGVDVILDPLEQHFDEDNQLLVHIDGLRSCGNPYRKAEK